MENKETHVKTLLEICKDLTVQHIIQTCETHKFQAELTKKVAGEVNYIKYKDNLFRLKPTIRKANDIILNNIEKLDVEQYKKGNYDFTSNDFIEFYNRKFANEKEIQLISNGILEKNKNINLKNLVWHDVIAISMYKGKKAKYLVPELVDLPEIKQKVNSRKTLNQTIWKTLQLHTTENSSTVNYTRRSKPYLFDKDYGKHWYLTDEGKKYIENNFLYYINDNKTESLNILNNNTTHISPPLNQILYGPPGTGKTYNTVVKAMEIILQSELKFDKDNKTYKDKNNNEYDYQILKQEFDKAKENHQIEFVTFHQSYSYEEFVEGIKPQIKEWNSETNNDLKYIGKDGIFKRICNKAEETMDKKHVLIIDEINRGNISKIFGELITLIEEDKRIGNDNEMRITLPYSQQKDFGVPNNLYIIGTMNTSDRSIASIDIALRRRFKFVEIMPKPDKICENLEVFGINVRNLFETLNKRISILLDRDHQIGHSYFMKLNDSQNSEEDFQNIWFDEIMPLLNEYFYGDWEKLQALLGKAKENDSFITTIKDASFANDYSCDDDEKYDFAQINDKDTFEKALKCAFPAKDKNTDNQNELVEATISE